MNRQGVSSHPSIATQLVGLSLVVMLLALFSGGAYRSAVSTPVDARFISELDQLVVAHLGDKIRVNATADERGSSLDDDSDSSSWLAGTGPCPDAGLSCKQISLSDRHTGMPSYGRFLLPVSRAPPLA